VKILIYGAGVIGTSYGWQLAEAGQDVTFLVRQEKRRPFKVGSAFTAGMNAASRPGR